MGRNYTQYKGIDRRNFIAKTLVAGAGLTVLTTSPKRADAQGRQQTKSGSSRKVAANSSLGRRRLGKLEVSAIGMGVQNMHRLFLSGWES